MGVRPSTSAGKTPANYKENVPVKTDIDMTLVDLETPLRPASLARIAFPDGSVTERAVRDMMLDGRLDSITISGKRFSTLRAVKEMTAKLKERA
jgi:hypothetical protein